MRHITSQVGQHRALPLLPLLCIVISLLLAALAAPPAATAAPTSTTGSAPTGSTASVALAGSTSAAATSAAGVVRGLVRASATHVLSGQRLTLTGATGLRDRLVQLQRIDTSQQWRSLGSTRAARDGSFVLGAPTWWYGAHYLRAFAPASGSTPAWASDPVRVVVVPTYATGGAYTSYTLGVGRWNPCKPIGYRINTAGAYAGWDAQVHAVMAEMSRATGMTFVNRGTTQEVAFGPIRQADSDIVLSWATPAQNNRVAGGAVGSGGSYYQRVAGGVDERFRGSIVLDRTAQLDTTWDGVRTTSWATVMLHELAHVLGLGHTADRTQLMAASAPLRPRFGRGDLVGLGLVGAARPCIAGGVRR